MIERKMNAKLTPLIFGDAGKGHILGQSGYDRVNDEWRFAA
jgi:hypothetical protein